MPYYFFIWTDESEAHVAEHGVSIDDFESIVCNPVSVGKSRSSGYPIAFGFADDGREIACVYEEDGDDDIIPITAYEV